jgi:hypothetical protein
LKPVRRQKGASRTREEHAPASAVLESDLFRMPATDILSAVASGKALTHGSS